MSYGFNDLPDVGRKNYLRQPGVHTNAKFLRLTYTANENWEAFNIEIETSDGQFFTERTFGPTLDKVFPKQKWVNGQPGPMETRQEALDRVQLEISNKLYQLALCFIDAETLKASVKDIRTFKELVDKVITIIGAPTIPINFLTVWKNSDQKQKSNLIIAERVKWVEPYVEGKAPTLRLTKWQLENQMLEKYPYQAPTPEGNGEALVGVPTEALEEDLPF